MPPSLRHPHAIAARAALLALSTIGAVEARAAEPAPLPCGLVAEPPRAVVDVVDGDTVTLDDGSTLRLLGTLPPKPPITSPEPERWPPADASKAALAALLTGASIEIAPAGHARDRYGRRRAHAFLTRDGARMWVAAHLLAEGHARYYGLAGEAPCADELLAIEDTARTRGAGLWANATYAVRSAGHTSELMRLRSTFQLVEGRIARLGRSQGRIYLNFGPDWRTDFTVGISSRLAGADAGWLSRLAALEGARVRVRGWIERRNGPYIELEAPALLEVLEPAPDRAAEERADRPRSP
ncbi:MAG: thermonuclease family protein [Pseudomonadota bacterium]